MRIFSQQDGGAPDIILHFHSGSEAQTVAAVLSAVTKHLNVVCFFMMCAVGLGICVWTVQAGGFNYSLPLKLIQNHLDPLFGWHCWRSLLLSLSPHPPSLPLSLSGLAVLSVSLTRSSPSFLLCCQFYLSFHFPWTILFVCHSAVRAMCMWVWGCWGGIYHLEGISWFITTSTGIMYVCWASTQLCLFWLYLREIWRTAIDR